MAQWQCTCLECVWTWDQYLALEKKLISLIPKKSSAVFTVLLTSLISFIFLFRSLYFLPTWELIRHSISSFPNPRPSLNVSLADIENMRAIPDIYIFIHSGQPEMVPNHSNPIPPQSPIDSQPFLLDFPVFPNPNVLPYHSLWDLCI